MQPHVYTLASLGKLLGVSAPTLRRATHQLGICPAHAKGSKRWVFTPMESVGIAFRIRLTRLGVPPQIADHTARLFAQRQRDLRELYLVKQAEPFGWAILDSARRPCSGNTST